MASGRYILDADNNPVECHNLIEWAIWFEDPTRTRQTALTVIDGITVSTIFLGVDAFVPISIVHAPILWESLVSGMTWQLTERYCYKQSALKGHYELVERITRSFPINRPLKIVDLLGVFTDPTKKLVARRIKP